MSGMVSVLGEKRTDGPRKDVVPWVYLVAFLVGTAAVVGFMWYHIGNERRVAWTRQPRAANPARRR